MHRNMCRLSGYGLCGWYNGFGHFRYIPGFEVYDNHDGVYNRTTAVLFADGIIVHSSRSVKKTFLPAAAGRRSVCGKGSP